jgi:putative hydrolase of the HAD superfamily
MIETIVFDFGKVIACFDHRLASRRLSVYTTMPEQRIFATLYGNQLDDDYESGRITTPQFLEAVRQRCELRCTDSELVTAYSDIFWPNRGTCELLPRLTAKHPLILLSNTNDLHAQQFLPQMRQPLSHFRHVIMSHQVKARKPRPEIFAHAQRLAECSPDRVLFIDDLPANVEGAKRFGWQGLVFESAEQLARDLSAREVMIA